MWTCLQAISDLRVLLAPFLPFSSQHLHEALGHLGQLAPGPRNRHDEALLELDGIATAHWGSEQLPSGHPLGKPAALFTKLPPETARTELDRLVEQPHGA